MKTRQLKKVLECVSDIKSLHSNGAVWIRRCDCFNVEMLVDVAMCKKLNLKGTNIKPKMTKYNVLVAWQQELVSMEWCWTGLVAIYYPEHSSCPSLMRGVSPKCFLTVSHRDQFWGPSFLPSTPIPLGTSLGSIT